MSYIFYQYEYNDDYSGIELDFSPLDLRKVEDMSYAFASRIIKTVKFGTATKNKTLSLKKIDGMFRAYHYAPSNSAKIKDIDLSNLVVDKVENFADFSCGSTTSINLNNWKSTSAKTYTDFLRTMYSDYSQRRKIFIPKTLNANNITNGSGPLKYITGNTTHVFTDAAEGEVNFGEISNSVIMHYGSSVSSYNSYKID